MNMKIAIILGSFFLAGCSWFGGSDEDQDQVIDQEEVEEVAVEVSDDLPRDLQRDLENFEVYMDKVPGNSILMKGSVKKDGRGTHTVVVAVDVESGEYEQVMRLGNGRLVMVVDGGEQILLEYPFGIGDCRQSQFWIADLGTGELLPYITDGPYAIFSAFMYQKSQNKFVMTGENDEGCIENDPGRGLWIWTLDLDTNEFERLTGVNEEEQIDALEVLGDTVSIDLPEPGDGVNPFWSFDGKKIYYDTFWGIREFDPETQIVSHFEFYSDSMEFDSDLKPGKSPQTLVGGHFVLGHFIDDRVLVYTDVSDNNCMDEGPSFNVFDFPGGSYDRHCLDKEVRITGLIWFNRDGDMAYFLNRTPGDYAFMSYNLNDREIEKFPFPDGMNPSGSFYIFYEGIVPKIRR